MILNFISLLGLIQILLTFAAIFLLGAIWREPWNVPKEIRRLGTTLIVAFVFIILCIDEKSFIINVENLTYDYCTTTNEAFLSFEIDGEKVSVCKDEKEPLKEWQANEDIESRYKYPLKNEDGELITYVLIKRTTDEYDDCTLKIDNVSSNTNVNALYLSDYHYDTFKSIDELYVKQTIGDLH